MKLSTVSLDDQLSFDEAFFSADKRKSFLEFDNITLGVCSQACPKCPNNKCTISLQYLKEKKVKDEVDFMPADKHQRFLQVITVILDVCNQACPNYSK